MRVIVVGAGEVGSYVADRLSRQGVDVFVIERNAKRAAHLAETVDVEVLTGSGTHPEVLAAAGIDTADLLVAVTKSDEVNLIASMLAKQADVPRTVVRIEAPELRGLGAAELRRTSAADLFIDPDEETAQEVLSLIQMPGASEVARLGNGEVAVIGARLSAEAPLVGTSLLELGVDNEPEWDFIVASIKRGDETIIPRGDYRIQEHDLVRIVCKQSARRKVAKLLGLARDIPREILLLGGGRTGTLVAKKLSQKGARVQVIERDPERARELAEDLEGVRVLLGDVTDSDVLDEADLSRVELVAALTGEDDANVLASVYAKAAGVPETIAVVHRLNFLGLLDRVGVDAALSPRTATANAVLRFVRGDVAQVATFLQSDAELLEFEIHTGSNADGRTLSELGLPRDVLIAAIVRDGRAQIARGRTTLRKGDHVIVMAEPESVDLVAKTLD
ncbi:MAG: Trk system potassium transporter TrkA [Acidimicrobiales bacterium]